MSTDTGEEELLRRIGSGELIEREDVTEGYRWALCNILTVSADTELLSAPAYWYGARHAPSTNTLITELAIIQDELGHAHLAYRLLSDLGVDVDQLLYERPPSAFKNAYAFDLELGSWTELVVANALWDRAGYTLLGDVFHHTSYGPWKRALVKVDKEEFFHVRQGENWLRALCRDPEGRAQAQRAVDWMFPLAVEWFGLPDTGKRHGDQLKYRLKGLGNDALRQVWLGSAVPLCEANGLRVPAHRADDGTYVLDYPFPCHFDPEARVWDFSCPCSWEAVQARWRRRGPRLQAHVAAVRAGHRELPPLEGVQRIGA